jgi:tetratricopeptide (TPR) repeat protein
MTSGSVLSSRADFTGSYAYSSLQPVSTYVRRPDLERQLHEQLISPSGTNDLQEMRTAVVCGLGGAGKSQLALKYLQEHRKQYRAVFWIEANQKETIERDFIQIYKLLFPNPASSTIISVEDAISGVKVWLQGQKGRYLWVMDSADEIEDDRSRLFVNLNHYLPEAPQLDRIITTRSSRARGLSTRAVAVAEMSEDEAIQVFRQCARLEQTSEQGSRDILAIVQELGCLALAVTLAGSYVHETPGMSSDLGLYLTEFKVHREQLLGQRAHRVVHQYGESVLSTWEISFEAVQQQAPVAAQLLSLLAFLNFDDIFLELLTPGRTINNHTERPRPKRLKERFSRLLTRQQWSSRDIHTSKSLESPRWVHLLSPAATTVDKDAIIKAFKTLQAYSLVSWRADQEAYSMHKLVHAWGHDRQDLKSRQDRSLAVLELLATIAYTHRRDLSTQTRLLPHVMANFTAMSSACGSGYHMLDRDREYADELGCLLRDLGRWDDEYEVRVFLKGKTELVLGQDHPLTLEFASNVATVLREQGKYEEAEMMYQQTLKLQRKVLPQMDPATLATIDGLGIVLDIQRKYEEAEMIHRQTLELRRKVLRKEDPATLKSMSNLAITLSQQAKYEEAETMQRQTLELQRKVLGPEHPDTLGSMNNLGSMLSTQGRYEEAEIMYRQTPELQRKVLGRHHPDTLVSMNYLAIVLDKQGKYVEAKISYRQTLELQRKVLGVDHPDTLESMRDLACVLVKQGKYAEAEILLRQSLEVQRKVLGREHPYTLFSMRHLAWVLEKQGKSAEDETKTG